MSDVRRSVADSRQPKCDYRRVVVGLISDTHGLVRPEVYEALEGVEMILHAGDVGGSDVLTELEAIALAGKRSLRLAATLKLMRAA